MTEAEWLACTDPQKMLEFLRGRASDRKRRLFACAWCRCLWHLLTDERSRRAVEVAERYADREAMRGELVAAWEAARAASAAAWGAARAAWAVAWAAAAASWAATSDAACDAARAARHAPGVAADDAAGDAAGDASAALLRDIFANPFRPVSVDPAWLSWQGGTVPRLAQAVYEERLLPSGHLDPARLAVLADALEEAGCSDPEILGHLRGTGPHVRGCWALDLVRSVD
jgi:hypothetical protein